MEGGIGLVGLVGLCPYLNKNWRGEDAVNSDRSKLSVETLLQNFFDKEAYFGNHIKTRYNKA